MRSTQMDDQVHTDRERQKEWKKTNCNIDFDDEEPTTFNSKNENDDSKAY